MNAPTGPLAGAAGRQLQRPETSIWNDYWHFDRLSAFDDTGSTNYGGAIADGWTRFFEQLPPDASILDLCTGNGAVAVLAAEAGARSGKRFRISAADAADINPYRHVTKHRDALAAIDFWPATPAEHLPWADASFDAVVSQYGIEYTDRSLAVAELARVISPGGRVRLVVHAADGPIVERSRRLIPEIDFLLHDVDLAGVGQRCLRSVRKVEEGKDSSPEARAAAAASLAAFEAALRRVHARSAGAVDRDMLTSAGQMLTVIFQRRHGYHLAQAIGLVEEIRSEWRHHRARLVAQIEAALAAEGCDEFAGQLLRAGAVNVETSVQAGSAGPAGYCIVADF